MPDEEYVSSEYIQILRKRSKTGLLNEYVKRQVIPLVPEVDNQGDEPTYESVMMEIFGHL